MSNPMLLSILYIILRNSAKIVIEQSAKNTLEKKITVLSHYKIAAQA